MFYIIGTALALGLFLLALLCKALGWVFYFMECDFGLFSDILSVFEQMLSGLAPLVLSLVLLVWFINRERHK
jgi:hypothetical protein